MLITVFTPTYNRADHLPILYESLKQQVFRDFEWLIVDDGSSDDTELIVSSFQSESLLQIRYLKVPNGGKHRAINTGAEIAAGKLFFIVDSDDYLLPLALQSVSSCYLQVIDDERFAGVCGLRCYPDGTKIGGEQPFEKIDTTPFDVRYKYGIRGDLAEVVATNILLKYPFPDIPGERFCPEALIWNRIGKEYLFRYFYEKIYVCEYLSGGLTDRITAVRRDSPLATVTYYTELLSLSIPFMDLIKAALNLWRFAFCLDIHQRRLLKGLPLWVYSLQLPGLILFLLDSQRLKRT